MNFKKGFTLIELLTVIVILAIIALTASPIIVGLVEDSRNSAAERSAENYVDGIKIAVANKNLNREIIPKVSYKVMSNGNLCSGTVTGDVTGEMGPFYNYADNDGTIRTHNNWYADESNFVSSFSPWIQRGSVYAHGVLVGQFHFSSGTGNVHPFFGSRLVITSWIYT